MTNPNTNTCVVPSVRIGLRYFILWIFNITILHLFTMCCFIFNSWSSQAPKYLIVLDLFTSWPFILMLFVIHFDRVCHEPNRINSVLALFSLRQFLSIQVWTSPIQCSKSVIQSISGYLWLGETPFLLNGHLQNHSVLLQVSQAHNLLLTLLLAMYWHKPKIN